MDLKGPSACYDLPRIIEGVAGQSRLAGDGLSGEAFLSLVFTCFRIREAGDRVDDDFFELDRFVAVAVDDVFNSEADSLLGGDLGGLLQPTHAVDKGGLASNGIRVFVGLGVAELEEPVVGDVGFTWLEVKEAAGQKTDQCDREYSEQAFAHGLEVG